MKHETLFTQIKEVIGEKHMLNHPFYQVWSKGELTKEELADYLKQYYYVESSFPRLMSALHSNTSNVEMRQVMLKNLNDEEQGENNHVAQLLRLCQEGFGLSEAELKATTPHTETVHLIEMLKKATGSKDIREGLSAMIVYKQQVGDVAATKLEGLKQYYGITDENALEFYTTHSAENTDYHQMLDKLVESEDQPVVMATIKQIRDSFWEFLDGVTTPEILARCEA